jgi:L-threonylcarbamoyladenylate synthase
MKTVITKDPQEAAYFINRGGIVVFPTETVYGIGASSRNFQACRQIYSIKNRPSDNPFIVHTHRLEKLVDACEITESLIYSISKFSPGAITYILPKKDRSIFSSDLPTVGLRIPSHPTALHFLGFCIDPVSAPSANISGKPSITQKEYAIEVFDGKVDAILLGEEPSFGVESTVIDLSSKPPVLLRPGGVSFAQLEKVFQGLYRYVPQAGEITKSPGLKYRHYSPDCLVEVVDSLDEVPVTEKTAQIGFSIRHKIGLFKQLDSNLEYSQNLYSFFIECEKKGMEIIYCQKPQDDELAEALWNRLSKAASKK